MKLAASALAATLVFASLSFAQVKAADPTVYVTIVNGDIKVTQKEIALTDADKDGALTINDALILTHDATFEGGAAAGYQATEGAWGLGISKLWGVENGGSYGYYVNNASAMGLRDTMKNGDYLTAFVYQDTTAYSDAYSYFNVNTLSASTADEISLTVYSSGYDESWNPVSKPLAKANIYVNGVPVNTQSAEDGTVKLGTMNAGTYVITADSDTAIIVKPVCTVTVSAAKDSTPKTGDDFSYTPAVVACVLLLIIVPSLTYIKKKNEK